MANSHQCIVLSTQGTRDENKYQQECKIRPDIVFAGRVADMNPTQLQRSASIVELRGADNGEFGVENGYATHVV